MSVSAEIAQRNAPKRLGSSRTALALGKRIRYAMLLTMYSIGVRRSELCRLKRSLPQNIVGNWTPSGSYIAETGMWGTVQSVVDSNLNGDPAADRTVVNFSGDPNKSSGVTPCVVVPEAA